MFAHRCPSTVRPVWPTALLLVLTLVGFATPAVPAAPKTEEEIKPLFWPESGRPQLRYRVEEVPFDGYIMVNGYLSGAGFSWVTNIPSRWDPVISGSARFSITFKSKVSPQGTFGLAIFDAKEFLPDLSADSWARYLDGLNKRINAFRLIRQSSTVESAEAEGPRILGEPTREILFYSRAPNGEFTAELTLFLFHENKLLAFSLIGPEQFVTAQADGFRLMIAQFSPR